VTASAPPESPAGPAARASTVLPPAWAAAVRYLARRLTQLAVTLVVASVAIYGSVYLAPGDPASFLAGGRALSPAALAAIRIQYHLDKPFPVQYWDWLTGVLHGNLGLSVQFRQPVAGLIASRIPVTAFLCVYAAVLVLGGGMLLGAVGALAGRRLDQLLTVVLAGGAAVPSFVASLGLIYALAVWSHVFPSGGLGTGFAGQLDHLTLPAVALALAFLAVVARVTRQAMRDRRAASTWTWRSAGGCPGCWWSAGTSSGTRSPRYPRSPPWSWPA
jgi:peptide/nickel transport system permease protein